MREIIPEIRLLEDIEINLSLDRQSKSLKKDPPKKLELEKNKKNRIVLPPLRSMSTKLEDLRIPPLRLPLKNKASVARLNKTLDHS